MENMEIYERCREVPDSAKKTIPAGRLKGMTDISPMWRIKKLTEVFGPCGFGWYYTVTDRWTEAAGSETAAFVDIELYVRTGEEWSKPIRGTGGSKFVTQERTGLFVSDECYKMATTDALSVACKQLGIGADVYWDRDVTKYSGAEGQGAPGPQGQGRGGQQRQQNGQRGQQGQQRQQGGQRGQRGQQAGQGQQNGQQAPQQPQQIQMLDQQRVNALFMELRRTGVGWKSLLANYGASDVHYLTVEQYENAMENLRRRPTNGMPEPPEPQEPEPQQAPPDDMDESGLPWYEPGR